MGTTVHHYDLHVFPAGGPLQRPETAPESGSVVPRRYDSGDFRRRLNFFHGNKNDTAASWKLVYFDRVSPRSGPYSWRVR